MSDQVEEFMNTIRPIEHGDYDRGYQELFATLTDCKELSRSEFEDILAERTQYGWRTWVLEAQEDGKTIIIATTSLVLERKFYRDGRHVGHIEDVIVLPRYQHHKLGTHLNEFAIEECRKLGCYKVILDCKESLEDFYMNAGMKKTNIQMGLYY